MSRLARALANGWVVAGLFSLITVFATWPLASVITTRIVPDVGDPVFNSWVMMWTGGQLLRFLSGDMHALADYWNGNIFYPAQNTIAFSEHLTPQMLQILPIFAATDNIVLCYNLLFLSSIMLSALGMYLFVRELTGQPVAGFVAGLAFAFAPYRADQYTHLQIISTQWMPLALYGFQRYFATARPRALVGAVAAVVVQALSCGYYLFFFTPFAAAFCIFEGIRQGAWRHRRTWWQVGAAAVVGLIVLWPFLRPYMAVRESAGEFGRRSPQEVRYFSADTWALGTAPGHLGVWRWMKAYERPEGAAFPGATILATGLIGVIVVFGASVRRGRARKQHDKKRWRQVAAVLLGLSGVILVGVWLWLFVLGGGVYRDWWVRIRVKQITDITGHTLAVLALAIALLPGFRQWLKSFFLSRGGFIVCAWIAAIVLAFGPVIYVKGVSIGAGPYALFYNYVPGFDGLRVPARYFMLAALFLSALCGIAVAAITRRQRLIGYLVAAVVSIGIVYEGRVVPFITSKVLWVPHYEWVGSDYPRPPLGAVYETVEALPQGTVLAEFPFGSDPFEIRSMYFAAFHRKPLVNGYSGFFPPAYNRLKSYLENDPLDKPAAFKALIEAGVTHVVVHEQPFPEAKGPKISAWIRDSGGREIAASGTDRLFAIR